MIDLEITLVEAFNWSLKDIDDTDIETLLPFVMRFGNRGTANGEQAAQTKYCDEVSWL